MSIRRTLIIGLCLGLLIDTTSAAQSVKKVPRIALASPNTVESMVIGGARTWTAFLEEMRRLGYIEGQNLIVERYSTKGDEGVGAKLATRVIANKPDVIVVGDEPLIKALMAQTKTIPIVVYVTDPVILGIVPNYSKPGGNVTGVSTDPGGKFDQKRLSILRQVVPSTRRVGYLIRRDQWDRPIATIARGGAGKLEMTLVPALTNVPVHEADYDRIFAEISRGKVDAVLGPPTGETRVFRRKITGLALQERLPSIFCQPSLARAGGLMSYGPDIPDLLRRAARYVDKILKGAKPADLPIEQADKFTFVLNKKTAKALGITFPRAILLRANEVIE